ncbi:MAG: type II toxin-antitoxin system ParD family antitoxin [Proteobacteria bacterium]|nr:type II toxin-antitoxin system ParD family antitoxin [Pseudomonadota bacterium]
MATKVEKLSISITTAQAEAIRQAVEAGAYASTSDAVRDALRLWEDRRRERAAAIETVRRLWQEGLASGVAEERRSADQIKAAGRARLAKVRGA